MCARIYLEAGLRRRPSCICMGNPTPLEAQQWNLQTPGSRSTPEAWCSSQRKPELAGGPMMENMTCYLEAGLCQRPGRN